MKIQPNLKTLLLITFCVLSCKNDEKKPPINTDDSFKIVTQKTSEIDASNDVLVTGTTDDSLAFEYLNFMDFSKFGFAPSKNNEDKKIIGDSLNLVLHNIKNPQIMDLMAFTGRKNALPYYTRVLFTPGDTIALEIKNGNINFSGENAAHYNFFLKMNDPLRQQWAIYKDNPIQYKNELYDSYKSKDSIFKAYVEKHPKVSKDFKNLVSSELKFEYLYNLILPRNIKDNLIEGNYRNNKNGIVYLNALNNSTDNILDLKTYFNNISIEDFKRPDLINNDYFKRSLSLYIRYYFSNHEYLEYSESNFLKEKEFIEKNLEGDLKTLAIGRLINDYYSKGFGHGENDKKTLKNLIIAYADKFTEASFSNRMNEILEDLNAIDFVLPKSVLDEELLNLKGDTIKISQVLGSDKTKVINFWASWCGPCISEFKKGRSFKEKIKKERNLEFIYVSIDDDEEKWREQANSLDDLGLNKNQYLILDRKKSKLLKQMLIRKSFDESYFTIPRYSILDKRNKIINNNAPRPSDSLMFKNIINNIKVKY